MFRGGGSEYAINGSTCRLLDVQELLSDSGIGREMHVIVGQGQLDTILHATPEDRRGFIEEAAGVLKHRKRKEKALRKLDATEANLTRLADLLNELRRQLKPLGRQAEVARRASAVQMAARDAKARLLADDVVTLRTSQHQELADEAQLTARRSEAEEELARARALEAALDDQVRAAAPGLASAQDTWFGLTAVRERLLSTARVAAERVRNGAELPADEGSVRDPVALEAEAASLRAQEHESNARLVDLRRGLETAVAERQEAEAAHLDEDRRIVGLLRAAADRREGLARLSGQVSSLRSRATAAAEEIGRLEEARAAATERAQRAQHDFTALETQIASLDAGERGLDAEHEGAAALLGDLDARLAKMHIDVQDAQRERAALDARAEALELGLRRQDGAAALLAASDSVSGLLGSVATLLSVRSGCEAAVSAALGSAADAVAVADLGAAVGAIEHLKTADLGRAGLVLGDAAVDDSAWPGLPGSAVYAVDVIDAPATLRPALRRLLYKTAVVDDLDTARALVSDVPDVVAVTRDGDLVGGWFATGGSSGGPSLIEVQAALDQAREERSRAAADCERLQFELSTLDNERAETQGRVDVALARLHESDASMAAVAEELAQLGPSRATRGQKRPASPKPSLPLRPHVMPMSPGSPSSRRGWPPRSPVRLDDPDTTHRQALAERASVARQSEMDARLALRTSEERARALHGRADALLEAAAKASEAREQARQRRERRRTEALVGAAVAQGVAVVLGRLDRARGEAAQRRTEIQNTKAGQEEQLVLTRARVRRFEAELARLTDTVHRDEMLRTEQRMRMEQLAVRVSEELGLDLEALVADFGPDQAVPGDGPVEQSDGARSDDVPPPAPVPFVRAEQERRLRNAERLLAQLGRINPLALEEFSALEERHRFLSEQLDDLKRTRRDLLDIVKEVDDRVEQVFTEAFTDVAREFESIFGRLFPGGEGRLVLTDPADPLVTGVDVEARPAGKKVKRLSLLSGGERSLVGVAFLVALFKARPSPFYILDEVEAALDDTNLGRLLEIYEELASSHSSSSSPTRSARWSARTRCTASRCAATGSRPSSANACASRESPPSGGSSASSRRCSRRRPSGCPRWCRCCLRPPRTSGSRLRAGRCRCRSVVIQLSLQVDRAMSTL